MVGRDEELEFMMGFLGEAISGKGTLILVSGETGIGKTRLVEEFRTMAVSTGCRFLMGCCLPGSPSPYMPFLEAFQRCIAARIVDMPFLVRTRSETRFSATTAPKTSAMDGSEHALTSSPHFREDMSKDDPMTGSERALFSTLQALRTMTIKKPVVLCIEDLHWADSASIQLLHFLARNSADLRVLLVGTYRTEGSKKDASGTAHPLLDTLRVMRREGVCHEIYLNPLSVENLKVAIEGMLGNPIDHLLLERIATESGGNPLFAIETVRLLLSTRSIVLQAGTWRSISTAGASVPLTIKEIISRRIERLPRPQSMILDCAAVVGDCFDPETLETALGLTKLALLEDLDYLEKDYQIIHETEGRYRFDHEVTRRIIYEQISLPKRRELHKIIGEILESRLPDESLYGELSLHFLNAGVQEKCVNYSLLAGDSCVRKGAMREAIPYYQRVIDVAREGGAHSDVMLQALEGLGIASIDTCNYQAALLAFDDFLKLSVRAKDRARVLRRLAECWLPTRLGMGDPSKSIGLLESAEECGEIDVRQKCEVLALRTMLALLQGHFDVAEEHCNRAEELLREIGSYGELALQLTDHASLLLSQGFVEKALEKLRAAKEANAKASDKRGQLGVIHCFGVADMHTGNLKEAMAHFDECLDIASKLGDSLELCWGHIYKGIVCDMMGEYETAVREAESGREHALSTESAYLIAGADAFLGHALIRKGDIDEAKGPCHEAVGIARSFDWRIKTPVRGLVAISMAELHGLQDSDEKSKREFEVAIDLFRGGLQGILFEALAHNWYGDSLAKQGALSDAETQYARAIGIYEKLGNHSQVQKIAQIRMKKAES
ncbi:MAG: AAA family ATPase [Methanomassiliicoccales archaeon]|nr:AAA family ATPase [Methanomassiliicoccales archaeon]